jgi:hypothetical protein
MQTGLFDIGTVEFLIPYLCLDHWFPLLDPELSLA